MTAQIEEVKESPIQLISDAEKAYAFFARMLDVLGDVRAAVQESTFDIDMYGDDAQGVTGKIGAQGSSAPIYRNYNGPYTIQTILATWAEVGFGNSVTGAGNVTAPGAGVTIASAGTFNQGSYVVSGNNTLLGAAAVTDLNNFGLFVGATQVATLAGSNSGVNFGPIDITVPAGGAVVAIKAIGAGTAGIVYVSDFAVTATSPVTSVSLTLGDKTLQLTPSQGIFNPQGLKIKMSRDDAVILTVTPAAACHLTVNGYAELRRRDYMYDKS